MYKYEPRIQKSRSGAGEKTAEKKNFLSIMYPVIQRVRVKKENSAQPVSAEEFVPSSRPAIIFESMGNDEQAVAVFKESEKYKGNTVCVYGINTQVNKLEEANASKLPDMTRVSESAGGKHHLRTFHFVWTAPEIDNGGQYKMPFVEARKLVMREALSVVEAVGVNIPKIYRWIDADAGDDTMDQIPDPVLNEFAGDENPRIGTGRYKWRHERENNAAEKTVRLHTSDDSQGKPIYTDVAEESYDAYKDFIAKINEEELCLREWYFRHFAQREIIAAEREIIAAQREIIEGILKIDEMPNRDQETLRQRRLLSESYPNSYDKERGAVTYSKDSWLPGFYFPESTFIMNEAAHSAIAQNSNTLGDETQIKESMKAAKQSGVLPQDVDYMSGLTVTKPIKHEFKQASYFFNAGMRHFFAERRYDRSNLVNALHAMRQSVFDPAKWNFVTEKVEEEFEKKREESVNKIDGFLRTRRGRGNAFSMISAMVNKLYPTAGR